MTADAFVANAKTLLDLGWHPIPLGGESGKELLAQGVTGRSGVDVTDEDTFREWADRWAATPPGLNLGSRMPVGVACIDVDCYGDKHGAETLAAKIAEWGPLPDTWSVTARTDGSRKMFFRVPEGWEGHGVAGPGIEVLQRHHRYTVAPHSLQDDVGHVCAYDSERNDCGQLPPPGELPVLPSAWVEGLRKNAPRLHDKGSAEDAEEIAGSFRGGPMDVEVIEALNLVLAAIRDGAGRHDSLNDALPKLARLGAAGRDGVAVAIRTAENEFASAVDDRLPDHEARREFQSSLAGAVRLIAGERAEMDCYTGSPSVFRADGSLDPASRLGQSLAAAFGKPVENGGPESSISDVLERFPLVGAAEMARAIPPIEWLIRGAWPRKSFGPIAGAKKTLKSYNAIAFALAVASGAPLLDQFEVVTPGPVLYLNGEGGRNLFHRRTQAIAKRYGVPLPELPLYAVHVSAPLDSPDFLGAVRHYLDEIQPELVILDPLYAYHPKGVDAANVYERGPMLAEFREQTVGDEAALLVADHFNKGAKELDLDSIGYAGMSAWADSWWVQRHARNGPNLETGEYPLEVQFGSRQWGGRQWNVAWKLPPLDQMDRAEEGEAVDMSVDWSVSRVTSATTSPEVAQASLTMQIYNLVKAQPGQLTKTGVKESGHVKARKEAIAAEVNLMLEAGKLRTEGRKLWVEPLTYRMGDER